MRAGLDGFPWRWKRDVRQFKADSEGIRLLLDDLMMHDSRDMRLLEPTLEEAFLRP